MDISVNRNLYRVYDYQYTLIIDFMNSIKP